MSNISQVSKSKCVGCFACQNICPTECINENVDPSYMDSYPNIDSSKCLNCGMCLRVCPVFHINKRQNNSELNAFLAVNSNESIRQFSSSGGVFGAIAYSLLEMGYTVFGAAINEHGIVQHIRVNTIQEINPVLGSKYVRSDITSVLPDICNLLKEDKKVLFSGTGCQCAAVYNYIESENITISNNLIIIDIVCHGVGKPYLWNQHYEDLLKKYGQIEAIRFRDKTYGWRNSGLSFVSGNSKFVFKGNEDSYINAYANNLCIRESCFNCEYKGIHRISDITLGDAWGINTDSFDSSRGVSLLFVHSSKGEELINSLILNGGIHTQEINDINIYLKANLCITESIKHNKKQIHFEEGIKRGLDFNNSVSKSTKISLFQKAKEKISIIKRK